MKLYTEQDLLAFGEYILSKTTNPEESLETLADNFRLIKNSINKPDYTRGQEVMSVSFNPGQRADVAAIKQVFADAFDEIDIHVTAKVKEIDSYFTLVQSSQKGDVLRLAAIAKTNLETAQMYAVKVVTR